MITLTQALAESRNIPAVGSRKLVGRDLVQQVATDFGWRRTWPTARRWRWGVESTLIDMTGAYAGILNGGSSVTPYGLVALKLQGDGRAAVRPGRRHRRTGDQRKGRPRADLHDDQVIDSGTGTRARLDGREAAGKTGTTNSRARCLVRGLYRRLCGGRLDGL
jgi:penicillin-binding protein 1A